MNQRRVWLWFLLVMAAFIPLLVNITERGQAQNSNDTVVIQGKVINGTPGAGLPGDLSVLMLVSGTDSALTGTGQTELDQDGRFVFSDVELVEGGSYTLSVDYGGVFYGTSLVSTDLDQEIILTVFEPTQDVNVISVARHVMVLVSVNDADKMATAFEFSEVANISDRTLLPDLTDQAQISFLRFALPPNATDLNVDTTLRGGDLISIPTGFALTAPVPPGDHNMIFSYSFPYEGSRLSYRQSLVQGAGVFQVLIPEKLTGISVQDLTAIPPVSLQGTTYRAWEDRNILPGRGLQLTLTGLPEPGVWTRFGSAITSGVFWQFAIPIAVGATLAVLMLWGLGKRCRPTTIDSTVDLPEGRQSATKTALVQAIASLDEHYKRGQVSEDDYQRRRSDLIAEALNNSDRPEDTENPPASKGQPD